MNKQNIIVGGIIIAIVLSLLAFTQSGIGPAGRDGQDGRDGLTVGAIPGNSIESSCFSQNGDQVCKFRQSFNQASSTLCAFNLAANTSASSTLSRFKAAYVGGTGGQAFNLILATSSYSYPAVTPGLATTGMIAGANIAAGGQGVFTVRDQATTSIPVYSAINTVNPIFVNSPTTLGASTTQWLVFYIDFATTSHTVSGTCTAEQELF